MRVLIATAGSRGDVQPYVALGRGLAEAGHEVTLLADAMFAPLVEGHGLRLWPVHTNPRRVFAEGLRRAGPRTLPLMHEFFQRAKGMVHQYFMDALAAAREADLILFSALGFPAAHVAEALEIPYVGAYLQPATPTRAFPNPFASPLPNWVPVQGWYNWLTFRAFTWLLAFTVRAVVNQCRQEILSLPPKPWRFYANVDLAPIPILYGYSSHVVPRPPDWGTWIHVVGYWFLDEWKRWDPPRSLLAFLEAGSPPIYVGFGSMVDVDAEGLTRAVVEAVQSLGERCVLLGGWTQLGDSRLPPGFLRVEEVPHGWLFPRCSVVVHHGGAGTTAAGFRAGVPQVIVPFYFDQPFWGRRVHALGVGPAPVPRRALTARRLAQAIQKALTETRMRENARRLGEAIRGENGVQQAIAALDIIIKETSRIGIAA